MQQLKQRLQEAAMMRQRMAQMEAPQKPRQQMLAQVRSPPNIPNIDLNARTNDGFTAFIIACGYGREDIVKLFLDRNIDFNVRHQDGGNAFHLACLFGNIEIVRLLLAYSNLIDVIIPPKDVLKEPTINILESFGYTVESLSFDSTDSTEFLEHATIYFRMMDMRCASYPSRWDNLFS